MTKFPRLYEDKWDDAPTVKSLWPSECALTVVLLSLALWAALWALIWASARYVDAVVGLMPH